MKRAWRTAAWGIAAAGATVGAQAGWNAYLARKGEGLASVLPGSQKIYDWRLGPIWYTVAGEGPAVLLVHGPGIGASSYEWRSNFHALSQKFRVYALDLLGFGLSDHPAMDHSKHYYVQLIDDFIRFVIKRETNVIASSHAAAYAIRLAHTRPERVHSLALVCPTGMGDSEGQSSGLKKMGRLMTLPQLGDSLYYLTASRASIAQTLFEYIYYDAGYVTQAMIDHYYRSAHQPGSRHAIAAFLQGELDMNVREEFAAIKQPVLMVWGAEARFTPLSNARAFQETNDRAILHILQEARQAPQDEKAEDFNRLVLSWLLPLTADQALQVLS